MRASNELNILGCHTLESIWQKTGGVYRCPKDSKGKRLGPLVGYAGIYEEGKHYVGDTYFDFAPVEEYPHALDAFAIDLAERLFSQHIQPDWVLGAPLGGILLGQRLSQRLDCRFLYAEKKVLVASREGQREQSTLVFDRHTPPPRTSGIIVEDVFNNFSTTEKLIGLVELVGARVIGLAGALNRSLHDEWNRLPIKAAVHLLLPEFRQDDPAVANDVAKGNVVWKPKAEWDRLMAAMATNPT